MRLEIPADPVAEALGAQEALEHAQHPGTLLVGQDVEHPLRLFGRPDGVLHRARRMEAVGGHGRVARDAEGHPPLPLRTEVVDAEQLHQRGEGFVEPDAVPPPHGDEVPEPHVGDLVRDDIRHALELEA